jgi:hypothetical protein
MSEWGKIPQHQVPQPRQMLECHEQTSEGVEHVAPIIAHLLAEGICAEEFSQ